MPIQQGGIKLSLTFDETPRPTKVLIYGLDGTGKSTGAELYCKKRGLNPVCIDFDKTNWTDVPKLKLSMRDAKSVMSNIKLIIRDITNDPDYDTLIIDGVGTLSDLLIPENIKLSQQAYLQRTNLFKKIWKCLLTSDVNVIFIGQKDLIVTEESENSKLAEKINNMVDWKFRCYRKGDVFTNECTKWRREKEELY